MVDKKISELPEVTSVSESDVVPVVVDDNGLITSKVQVGNLRAPPDNKTLALDEDEKLSFSQNTYDMFGELILKNLINSYENNLSDLTYDFAQADSFHIENGINDTVNTTTDLNYINNHYINETFNESIKNNSSYVNNTDETQFIDITFTEKGFINEMDFSPVNNRNITCRIRDAQNNTLAFKQLNGEDIVTLKFTLSDYTRLINKNETVTLEIGTTGSTRNYSITQNSIIQINDTSYMQNIHYQVQNITNGSLNVSVSDVSDTDSVALFIDSDKPNLITPTYNTSVGQLQSIDFDFSDTETINFYGYVLYIYK